MKMTRYPIGREGFTLVELLVAISILSIGLLGVASMQSVAITNTAVSHRITAATELANEAMEDIMAWDPEHPKLNSSAADTVYAGNVKIIGGGTFDITYTTTVDTPSLGTTRIDVTVSEVGAGSRPISPVALTGFRKVV